MSVHFVFDILAALSAMAMTTAVYRWRIKRTAFDPEGPITAGYLAALIAGAVIGGYGFGTFSLWQAGLPGFGRSILGALAGAILAIEVYKRQQGIRRSTGLIFAAPFAVSVVVGRIGCLLSGLDDNTHGIPTGGSWGRDFGDGILRHPVQLYESLAMAVFLGCALWAFARRWPFFMNNGFYLVVAFYSGQRFLSEFLMPYPTVIGPLNIFHLLSLGVFAYGIAMIMRGERRHERAIA